MDGRSNRGNKAAFSNFSSEEWAKPKRFWLNVKPLFIVHPCSLFSIETQSASTSF